VTAIPTDLIDIRSDARAIDAGTAAGLAESIAEIGLINPISVRANGERWELIAGRHRITACQQLGLAEVECIVVEADDLHAELAMIDENLMRAELSPSDRAKQTYRRKVIYIELHPETEAGQAQSAGANRAQGNNVAENFSATSFAADTAAKTGQTDRTVRLHASRGEKVIDEVLDMIRGTKLDTGTYLDVIKGFPPNDQYKAAKRDLANLRAQERERAKTGISRRVRVDPIHEDDAKEKWLAAGVSWWNRGPQEWRDAFLAEVSST
jgi:ParB/RepB/Spo0J family partition protein